MADAIVAEGLVKTYGDVKALDGLDLTVPEGTVLGLLGPNGAGKTTTVRIFTTLLRPDEGRVIVGGLDVLRNAQEVRGKIGLSGQYAAVDEHLTGYENLDMIGRLYHLGRSKARQRARELLEQFDLAEAADRPVKTYSGGMRRRLDLAGALVAKPPLLFLDEPTTGLDPRGRLNMWDVISELVDGGTTLLLTTQYLEEADRLADDIVVIHHGRAIAHGTADELKRQTGGERLVLGVSTAEELPIAASVLEAVGTTTPTIDETAKQVVVPVSSGVTALVEVVRKLDASGITPLDIGVRRPTLDDVFMKLTGHQAEDESVEAAAAKAKAKSSRRGEAS